MQMICILTYYAILKTPQGFDCHYNHLGDIQDWMAQYCLQLDANKTNLQIHQLQLEKLIHNVIKYYRKPAFFIFIFLQWPPLR